MTRSLLLLATFLVASGASAQYPADLNGTWSGAVMQDGTPQLITLEFDTRRDTLLTTLTQPYNGFESFGYDFSYIPPEDNASGDGTLVSGLYGGMRLLVDLDEMNLRGTVSRRDSVVATVFLQKVVGFGLPQTTEREFRIPVGPDTLAGALVLPAEPEFARGPHPAVVLVTGRGYGSRNELSWLARLYARNGIAAVMWDGRGQYRSTGDAATVTSAQRISDVHVLLDWTLAQPEVDPEQVGVHGQSAGGWIAPLAIDGRDDVAFLLTTVGPAEPLADQQGHTTTQLMRDSDSTYTESEYEAAFVYQRDLVTMAQRGATWPEYEAVNAVARGARWAEHALIPDSLGLPDLDYYARMPGLDPRGALGRWRKPLLAIYGANDWIVPPQHNVPLLRNLTAENDNVTIEVLEMGHALERPGAIVGDGEWPQRYRRNWTRVPELFETLLTWLDANTVTAAERDR